MGSEMCIRDRVSIGGRYYVRGRWNIPVDSFFPGGLPVYPDAGRLQPLYVVAAIVQQQPHLKVLALWQPRMVFLWLCVAARVLATS